jgi:hypothetical protein
MRHEIRATSYRLQYRLNAIRNRQPAAVERAVHTLSSKKMIFCLTNGRTATKTLAGLIACISDVDAHHEASPGFHVVMQEVQSDPNLARDFWLYSKLPAIAKSPKPIYVETSHLFGKGFLEPLFELGGRPSIILLHRDRRATALSMCQLNDIPGRTRRGRKWYLSPPHAHHVGLSRGAEATLSDYQLCFWHVLEMEARQAHARNLARAYGLTVVDVHSEDLNDADRFADVSRKLGLTVSSREMADLAGLAGVRENVRQVEKREPPSVDLAATEAKAFEMIVPLETSRDV